MTVGVTLHTNVCIGREIVNERFGVTLNFSFLQLFRTKTQPKDMKNVSRLLSPVK
jgi:hypothetical protein